MSQLVSSFSPQDTIQEMTSQVILKALGHIPTDVIMATIIPGKGKYTISPAEFKKGLYRFS